MMLNAAALSGNEPFMTFVSTRLSRLSHLPAALLLVTGCTVVHGSGNVTTEERALPAFDEIRLEMDAHVTVIQNQRSHASVKAEDNLLAHIITGVEGHSLIIRTARQVTPFATVQPQLRIELPDLHGLRVESSGTVSVPNLSTDVLKLSLDGSGNVHGGAIAADEVVVTSTGSGNLDVQELACLSAKTNIDGSGNVTLIGLAVKQQVGIDGSGDYRSLDLVSQSAQVDIQGSGNAEVYVSEKLEAVIEGSGDIVVTGSPAITQSLEGSGKLIRR